MKKWNVGAYIRLSKEDGDNFESNSITNQKDIIKCLEKASLTLDKIKLLAFC